MISLHKILKGITIVTLVVFAITKGLVFFSVLDSSYITRGIEIACFLVFLPLFYFLMKSHAADITSTLLKKIKILMSLSILPQLFPLQIKLVK